MSRFVRPLLIAFVAGAIGLLDVAPAEALTCPSPPELEYGDVVECSLTTTGEIDTFTFDATAGDFIVVKAFSTDGVRPRIRVYDSSSNLLCQASTIGIDVHLIGCSLPSSGTYTLTIDRTTLNGNGDYVLFLENLISPSVTTPASFGELESAS